VVDVVCRFRVAVEGDTPETVAVRDWQVGEETAPAGPEATAQEKVTVPVNPPSGVRVRVDVAEAPGVANVTAVEEIPREGATGAACTVTEAVVEAVILPVESVPVMVTE
jgi:hypothetical protein